jgi:hypothetical protein
LSIEDRLPVLNKLGSVGIGDFPEGAFDIHPQNMGDTDRGNDLIAESMEQNRPVDLVESDLEIPGFELPLEVAQHV